MTEPDQYDFDRCVERVTVIRRGGKPVPQINIKIRENLHAYCTRSCWEAAEPGLADTFEVQTTYPPFGFVNSCCRCGASVNRTHNYVRYSIAAMTYSTDGSPHAACTNDRDWIVLCHNCEHPEGPGTAAASQDVEVLEPEPL
ncbi:MAG: hypothetical protein KDE63_06825 [Novosphingobium sp.]|nr:hypothetical protein [Novosphingobium sp.]